LKRENRTKKAFIAKKGKKVLVVKGTVSIENRGRIKRKKRKNITSGINGTE